MKCQNCLENEAHCVIFNKTVCFECMTIFKKNNKGSNIHDETWKSTCREILKGNKKDDRTGFGTLSIFGVQQRYDMRHGFPLLTLRKIHVPSIIHELLWFLGSFDEKWQKFGNSNIRYLLDNNVTFWSEWPWQYYIRQTSDDIDIKTYEKRIMEDDDFAIKWGSIGPGYGSQWTSWGGRGINQINEAINQLKTDPDSRRIIVEGWNVEDLQSMRLPVCHKHHQYYTSMLSEEEKILNPGKERKLSLLLSQRSQDFYLGSPYNIASYSILLYMMSQITNMVPDELILSIGDCHLYLNSIDAAKEILERESFESSILELNKNINNIYDFRFDDIKISNYNCHPNIKVEVAI